MTKKTHNYRKAQTCMSCSHSYVSATKTDTLITCLYGLQALTGIDNLHILTNDQINQLCQVHNHDLPLSVDIFGICDKHSPV
jgi:hypothetical protein